MVSRDMSQHIARSDPPTICSVLSCMGDAYVTIYTGNGEQIGICPSCLDELNRLQTSVRLPEQRAHVIDLHTRGQASTSTGDAQTLLDMWGEKQ